MLRRILPILSLIFAVSLSAVAIPSHSEVQKTRTSKKKSTKRKTKAPVIKVNTDSIEAAHRAQLAQDSINALQARIDAGDIDAINEMGIWYYHGRNVQQDYARAVDFWSQGASYQSPRALENLARCYEAGIGVPRDTIKAALLYTESIKCGNGTLLVQKIDSAPSRVFDALIVGACYENGEGVKPDITRAALFYSMAADKGSEQGIIHSALCYLAAADTVNAMKYLPLGAELGDVGCQYWTGALSLASPIVTDDEAHQAVDMILKAADAEMPEAQDMAASLYAKGRVVEADMQKAFRLYTEAANSGLPSAMWHLGNAYADALGTTQDFDRALYWQAKAIEAGYDGELPIDDDTPYALYLQGMEAYLVDADYTSAARLFNAVEKASKNGNGKVMEAVVLADVSNPKNQLKKAIKTLEKLSSTDLQAAYWLARICQANGQTDKANKLIHTLNQQGYITDIDIISNTLK